MNMRNSRGFTLIELMVVVAIIAIIAAIAYPSFSSQLLKSRRGDAYAGLQQAAAIQERWFAQRRNYVAQADPFTNTAAMPSPDGFYQIRVALVGTGYTVTATPVAGGPQARDTLCSSISLTHTGKKTSSAATALDCWR